jgi:hypothetical protein
MIGPDVSYLMARRASLTDVMHQFDITWFLQAMHKYRRILGEVLVASFFLQLFALLQSRHRLRQSRAAGGGQDRYLQLHALWLASWESNERVSRRHRPRQAQSKGRQCEARRRAFGIKRARGPGAFLAARVALDETRMQVEGKMVNLAPGMAVTVEIKTGQRRIIEYLMSPLLRYRQESLRER